MKIEHDYFEASTAEEAAITRMILERNGIYMASLNRDHSDHEGKKKQRFFNAGKSSAFYGAEAKKVIAEIVSSANTKAEYDKLVELYRKSI
jgi:hypothetical protein